MQLQGLVPIAPQAGAGGPGEEAGGTRNAGEGPQRAAQAREFRPAALEPQVAREGCGHQGTALADAVEKGGSGHGAKARQRGSVPCPAPHARSMTLGRVVLRRAMKPTLTLASPGGPPEPSNNRQIAEAARIAGDFHD